MPFRMFNRPDYNMLMRIANQHASYSDQSFYLPYSGLSMVNRAGPMERLLWQQQALTIQDLIKNQTFFKNNTHHNLFNNRNFRYANESLQSNQITAKELERFKKLLENAGSKPVDDPKRRHFDLDATRPDSPGSDLSSGFGTMPSPVSDLDSPPILITSDKSLSPKAAQAPKDTINYQGRDLLDLYTNMTYQWSFQMAVLPPHTMQTHFEYRSLYHRLGPFGMVDELATEKCSFCDFRTVVPKN